MVLCDIASFHGVDSQPVIANVYSKVSFCAGKTHLWGEGEMGKISKAMEVKISLVKTQMFSFLSELQRGGLPADSC